MIFLEIVNGTGLYLNETYIETVEENSDTVVKIHGGTVYVVKQTPAEIMGQIMEWNRAMRCHAGAAPSGAPAAASGAPAIA